MVASLQSGHILYLPSLSILHQAELSTTGPARINWEQCGSVISNQDRSWRNLQSAGNKIAFGLEKRLGHIKVYQWQSQPASRRLEIN